MSYLFGVRRGPAPSKRVASRLDRIASEHGCEFLSADIPGTGPQSWWTGPDQGEPWRSRLREDVARSCADAGLSEWCPSRRGGRPQTTPEPIDQQIVAKITARQRAALDARAERDGVTVGAVVRAAIDEYLRDRE